MACPYREDNNSNNSNKDEDPSALTYSSYLKVHELLKCQVPQVRYFLDFFR